jgi:hypothetical protein
MWIAIFGRLGTRRLGTASLVYYCRLT